jgi:hypothetical protein
MFQVTFMLNRFEISYYTLVNQQTGIYLEVCSEFRYNSFLFKKKHFNQIVQILKKRKLFCCFSFTVKRLKQQFFLIDTSILLIANKLIYLLKINLLSPLKAPLIYQL